MFRRNGWHLAASASGATAPTATDGVSIPALVRGLRRSSAYLRHAAPSLYITMDLPGGKEGTDAPPMRHRTRLLDSAGSSKVAGGEGSNVTSSASPHAHGVYLLTSTSMEDVRFEKEDSLHSTLVGLPRVGSTAEAQAFVSAHEEHLRHVRAVLLPEIGHCGAGHVVRALRSTLPDLRFVGSSFSQAFLSDPTFFDGVRRTILANTYARPDAVAFAELPPEAFQLAEEETAVAVASHGQRHVLPVFLHDAQREQRLKRARRTQPLHFYNQPIFYHDTAFDALYVGGALCRLPWLPHVLQEASRDTVLPAPPMLAAQRVAEGATHPLLATWRPTEAAEVFAAALRRVPTAQHILTEAFGELTTTDPSGAALAAVNAAEQLEGLRNRLSARLETDTGRDVSKWRSVLLKRLLREVISVNTASEATGVATMEALVAWALDSGSPLGEVATALTQTALSLPPTHAPAGHTAPASVGGHTGRHTSSRGSASPDKRQDGSELEGATGVALMQDLLAKKGLGGLGHVVKKEEIDVSVFLAMTPDDFRRVFKATFGVSKKLELLQLELREKL